VFVDPGVLQGVACNSGVSGEASSIVIEEVLEVDWFMTKIVLVEALAVLVPVVVLVLRFNVVHFFNCFVNLFLKLRKTKHLLPALLQLLVDCFEVIDLLIELLVLWFLG
jgi:hypothetical protein